VLRRGGSRDCKFGGGGKAASLKIKEKKNRRNSDSIAFHYLSVGICGLHGPRPGRQQTKIKIASIGGGKGRGYEEADPRITASLNSPDRECTRNNRTSESKGKTE